MSSSVAMLRSKFEAPKPSVSNVRAIISNYDAPKTDSNPKQSFSEHTKENPVQSAKPRVVTPKVVTPKVVTPEVITPSVADQKVAEIVEPVQPVTASIEPESPNVSVNESKARKASLPPARKAPSPPPAPAPTPTPTPTETVNVASIRKMLEAKQASSDTLSENAIEITIPEENAEFQRKAIPAVSAAPATADNKCMIRVEEITHTFSDGTFLKVRAYYKEGGNEDANRSSQDKVIAPDTNRSSGCFSGCFSKIFRKK